MGDLKKAWELYLKDSDDQLLLLAIDRFSTPLPKEYDFPFAHRIRDIKIGGKFFRVVRLANEDESIYIFQCDTPSLETEGVPYWLKGEKLQCWVRIETEKENDPEYEPESCTNWELFR